MENIDKDKINNACSGIWAVRYSLKGLSIAFENIEVEDDAKEKFLGLSVILNLLSKELKRVEDYLYKEFSEVPVE